MALEHLQVKATADTPTFDMQPSGMVSVKGRSLATDADESYREPIAWMDEYVEEPSAVTTVLMHLEYVNSHSAKSLVNLLMPLRKIKADKNNSVDVIWQFDKDDEEGQMVGTYISKALGFEVKMIPLDT